MDLLSAELRELADLIACGHVAGGRAAEALREAASKIGSPSQEFEVNLRDIQDDSHAIQCQVTTDDHGIYVHPAGHSHMEAGVAPVAVLFRNGEVWVSTWHDINTDEPHEISMKNAREEAREDNFS